jgi:hypothetical protein
MPASCETIRTSIAPQITLQFIIGAHRPSPNYAISDF